jgi:hypothetical protein
MTYYTQAIKAKDKNFLHYPSESVHSLPRIFFKYLYQNKGHAIAQAVSRWLPTAVAQSGHVGFCDGQK